MIYKSVFLIICFFTIYIMQTIQGKPVGKTATNTNIIFPEVIELVPKCPKNESFCEEVENYPENIFHEILENSPYEEVYFNSAADPSLHVDDRFHPETDYYICNSRKRIYYPKVARNNKGELKFVYNFNKYKQWITTEECTDKETPCTSFPGVPNAVKTKCVQQYTDILLLVADPNGEPIWDLFWFPSACICSYEPIINFNLL